MSTHVIRASRSHRRRRVYAVAEPNWYEAGFLGFAPWESHQPKTAASLVASYLDLNNNGHNAGVGVAPTWDSTNGWIFNGSTQYLTTTFVPEANRTQTLIIQFASHNAALTHTCSLYSGTFSFGIRAYYASKHYYMNGAYGSKSPGITEGNLCVGQVTGYVNGVFDMGIGSSTGTATHPLYIGCRNNNGVADRFAGVHIQAIAIYDCALTGAQVSAVATAMAAI
jgi:hypothetical protein